MQLSDAEKRSMIEHIRNHAEYPATKKALVEACNNMSEFNHEHKAWFEKNLPARSYKTSAEVIKALRL